MWPFLETTSGPHDWRSSVAERLLGAFPIELDIPDRADMRQNAVCDTILLLNHAASRSVTGV